MIAVVPDLEFRDGVIELDVSGAPSKDADPTTRGFIGILFRIQKGGPAELIYLRPSNTRADDQLARNHSVPYSPQECAGESGSVSRRCAGKARAEAFPGTAVGQLPSTAVATATVEASAATTAAVEATTATAVKAAAATKAAETSAPSTGHAGR